VRIVVLQHIDCEPAAAYLPVLVENGSVTTVRPGVDALPDPAGVDAVVVMGGPMGAYQLGDHPWLGEEIAFLAEVIDRSAAVWGVCLGAQLLAAALGADVHPGPEPEVGVGEVTVTARASTDPVLSGAPETFPALHWHGDTFDLPDGAQLLASTDRYPNQMFRHGLNYGLQFHLEASADLAATWAEVEEYRASLHAALGASGPELLLTGLRRHEDEILATATTMMTRWLALVRHRGVTG
jgi:GMP synthase-like glutamine amidotransferase